jgi:hypothetical protein
MIPKQQTTSYWGTYAGEGIWAPCADSDGAYPVDQPMGFRARLERIAEEVSESSRRIYDEFGIGIEGARWNALPREGYIRFTQPDGRTSYASYGVAASWAEHSHSWLWSWAMPEGWVHAHAQVVARRAREYGIEFDWEALTAKSLLVNEQEAWNLTKLVAHISDMPLVYRAKVNDINWHYFALSRPSWVN